MNAPQHSRGTGDPFKAKLARAKDVARRAYMLGCPMEWHEVGDRFGWSEYQMKKTIRPHFRTQDPDTGMRFSDYVLGPGWEHD